MSVVITSSHDRLVSLVGDWAGSGHVEPNPWGPSGATECTWCFRLGHGDRHLVGDFVDVREGGFRFEAHTVLTVDPATDEMLWFWFDSYGFPPLEPYRGRWQAGGLDVEKRTPRGVGRVRIALDGESLDFAVASRGHDTDTFAEVMRGRFARVVGGFGT